MATIVEELVGVLGLDVDESSFNQGTAAIDNVSSKLGFIAKAAAAAAVGLIGMLNSSTAEVKNLADSLSISTEFLENMGAAVAPLKMNFENVADLVEEMTNKLGESKGLEEITPVTESLQILGLEFKNLKALAPEEQFKAITQAAMELEDQQAAVSAVDILMGGEANKIIGLMRSTGKSFDELLEAQNRLNFGTEESRQGAVDWIAAWGRLSRVIMSVGQLFAGLIGKAFAPFMDAITDIIAGSKEFIHSNLDGFTKKLTIAFKILAAATAIFLGYKVWVYIGLIKNAFIAARAAAVSFNAAAFLVPVLIGAAVAAVVLLAQDIYKYFSTGGKADTAFGKFLNRFPEFKAFLFRAIDQVRALGNSIKNAFKDSGIDTFFNKLKQGFENTDFLTSFEAGLYSIGAVFNYVGTDIGVFIAKLVLFAQEVEALRQGAITLLGDSITWVSEQVNALINVISSISSVVAGAVNSAIGSFNSLIATVVEGYNSIAGVFNKIAALTGSSANFQITAPKIPALPANTGGKIINNTSTGGNRTSNTTNNFNIDAKGMNSKNLNQTIDSRIAKANSKAAKNNNTGIEY